MYTGYAIAEEIEAVFPFTSDLRTKKAVSNNLQRIIYELTGYPGLIDICIFPAASPKGENFMELAEDAARDGVTACDGVTNGYTINDVLTVEKQTDPFDSMVNELARDYCTSRKSITDIFNAWAANHENPDFSAFRDFYKRIKAAQVA